MKEKIINRENKGGKWDSTGDSERKREQCIKSKGEKKITIIHMMAVMCAHIVAITSWSRVGQRQ